MTETSAIVEIRKFLFTWRVASSRLFRYALVDGKPISEGVLSTLLYRLRKNSEVFSLRIGQNYYHFQPLFKRRYEHLKSLPLQGRLKEFRRKGFDHHLEVVEMGLKIQSRRQDLQIIPNVFSDHVSFARGTETQNKKFVPDLVVSRKIGPKKGLLYLEIELTQKAINRYLDKWAAYERDDLVDGCVYLVPDADFLTRLSDKMQTFIHPEMKRSDFFLSCILLEDWKKHGLQSEVVIYQKEGTQKRLLGELL